MSAGNAEVTDTSAVPADLAPAAAAKTDDVAAERKRLFDIVKDSADKNRTYFFGWLLFALYVLVTVAGTTDTQLLLPDIGVSLPLLGIQLPLFSFYLAVPILVIAVHFNLLQNLDSHAYKLSRWRDAWDGQPPRDELQAFLFDYAFLEKGGAFHTPVRIASDVLFYWFGPIVLLAVLLRFSDYQNPVYTAYHFVALVAALLITLRARLWLPRAAVPAAIPLYRRLASFPVLAALLIGLLALPYVWLTWALSEDGAIAHRLMAGVMNWPNTVAVVRELVLPRLVIPGTAKLAGPEPQLDLLARTEGRTVGDWWRVRGKGIDLESRNLRYAEFRDVDLRKANLWYARLHSATFLKTDLQGAYGANARMARARFSSARMQGMELVGTDLESTSFYATNLNGADLLGANLRKASLRDTTVIGAYLGNTAVGGASLRGTTFAVADRQPDVPDVFWEKLENVMPSYGAVWRLRQARTGISAPRQEGVLLHHQSAEGGITIATCEQGHFTVDRLDRSGLGASPMTIECPTGFKVVTCQNIDAWEFWRRIPCDMH